MLNRHLPHSYYGMIQPWRNRFRNILGGQLAREGPNEMFETGVGSLGAVAAAHPTWMGLGGPHLTGAWS